jgi:hypothetical protein
VEGTRRTTKVKDRQKVARVQWSSGPLRWPLLDVLEFPNAVSIALAVGDASRAELRELLRGLAQLEKLQRLELEEEGPVPEEIGLLHRLYDLDLPDCARAPAAVGDLVGLQRLSVGGALPDGLDRLTQLRALVAGRKVPAWLKRLPRLEHLEWSGPADGAALLRGVAAARRLRVLRLHLARVKDVSVLAKLTKLEEVSLEVCGVQRLPESIAGLRRLRLLDLRQNDLRTLPARLARCSASTSSGTGASIWSRRCRRPSPPRGWPG